MGNLRLHAKLVRGHQIASGNNPDSPYPGGSIELQLPHFQKVGLDLSGFFPATLNLSIAPKRFVIQQPDLCIEKCQWIDSHPAETFSFVQCEVEFSGKQYPAYVYYPHPETKVRDFQPDTMLEVIAPHIQAARYGDDFTLILAPHKISFSSGVAP